MHIGQVFELISRYDSMCKPLASLSDNLDPVLISRGLAEASTATMRKCRVPL